MSFSNAHALLVGVGSYKYRASQNVPVTVRDAQEIETVLTDPLLCGYPAENVTVLSDDKAGKESIEAQLKGLAERTDKDSTVFLFFCSHGSYGSDDNWYFWPHDVKLKRGAMKALKVTPSTGLGEARLVELIREIPASKLFIFFNTCHSGNMSQSLGGSDDDDAAETTQPGENLRTALLEEGKGTVIITASGSSQLSYFEGGGKPTVFTEAVCGGLRGQNGVVSRGGFIGAFGLYESVYFTVKDRVQAVFQKPQQPEITILKGCGSLPISLYQGNQNSLSVDQFEGRRELSGQTKVREATAEEAQLAFQTITKIGGDNNSGTQIAGNTGGDVITGGSKTVDQSRRQTMDNNSYAGMMITGNSGGDVVLGPKVGGNFGDGNYVGGNSITYGSISGNGNAVGAGASVITNNVYQAPSGDDQIELAQQFDHLRQMVNQEAAADEREDALEFVQELEMEVGKGGAASDKVLRNLVNQLKGVVPTAVVLIGPMVKKLAALGVETAKTEKALQ